MLRKQRYPERVRAQGRASTRKRYYADLEKSRAYHRAFRKSPKGIAANRRAARMRRGHYTQEALDWWDSLVDPECYYCGDRATTIDHVIPISRGGLGELSNLVPACDPCNKSKTDKLPWEWRGRDMAQICAHCGSPETQAGLDEVFCLACGRLSTFDGHRTVAHITKEVEIKADFEPDLEPDPRWLAHVANHPSAQPESYDEVVQSLTSAPQGVS